MNGEVSQDTGETHLGTLSLAAMETSCLNALDDKEEGVMHMEMEMEEVRRPGSSDCQAQELEGRDFQEEEIVRQEVPVIDVTTPSQDGSCEKLLWKFLAQTLLLFVVMYYDRILSGQERVAKGERKGAYGTHTAQTFFPNLVSDLNIIHDRRHDLLFLQYL